MVDFIFENDEYPAFDYLDEDAIFEMATISPKAHNFGVPLKMHILQPGKRKLEHGPRVKFIKHPYGDDFSISLDTNPSKIMLVAGDYSKIASQAELNKLIACVKKYRVPLLNMWFNPYMSQDDLLDEMADVDAGRNVVLKIQP